MDGRERFVVRELAASIKLNLIEYADGGAGEDAVLLVVADALSGYSNHDTEDMLRVARLLRELVADG